MMPVLSFLLNLSLLPALQGAAHPSSAEAMAEALGVKKIHLFQAGSLEVWCQDQAALGKLSKPVAEAWQQADVLLGGASLPEGMIARVLILDGEEPLQAYLPLFQAEAERLRAVAPGADFVQAVAETGSGVWSLPPTVLINGEMITENFLLTRVVHDLGALRARYAASPLGADPPEFFKEGFAGALIRRTVDKPAAIVSHSGAALDSTIQGYGVFSGIEEIANDTSNNPRNWPSIIATAVKKMRKEKELDPASRVDQLLTRSAEQFARADYAYSWAVIEFLLDDRMPYGGEARAAAADKKWKPGKETLPAHRRQVLHSALEGLCDPDLSGFSAQQRGEELRKLLLSGYDETPEQLHEAFLFWAENLMPKK